MPRARLPIILAVVIVALAGVAGGIALWRTHSRRPADLPMALPVQAFPALPTGAAAERPLPPAAPTPTPVPATAPAPPTPSSPSALQGLLGELNAALPKLGVHPPAHLTAATVESNLLVLTFNAEFRPYLAELSALDELTAALAGRAQAHGYRNLDVRVMDSRGRARSTAELTLTPPARRPRPEPIDDGVRR